MGRWTPDEHGCIYDEAGCFARLTPNKAERLATRHNADIDALTAERDTLRGELARVKAESLRVVVDGEACSIRDARNKQYSMYECHVAEFFVSPINGKAIIIQDAFTHKKLAIGSYDTIVQPVRLERWEDE